MTVPSDDSTTMAVALPESRLRDDGEDPPMTLPSEFEDADPVTKGIRGRRARRIGTDVASLDDVAAAAGEEDRLRESVEDEAAKRARPGQ